MDEGPNSNIVIPESPPMSQLETESQQQLLSRLQKNPVRSGIDGDLDNYTIVDESSTDDEDDGDLQKGPHQRCNSNSMDVVIDMDIEDDDEITEAVVPMDAQIPDAKGVRKTASNAEENFGLDVDDEEDLTFLAEVEKIEQTVSATLKEETVLTKRYRLEQPVSPSPIPVKAPIDFQEERRQEEARKREVSELRKLDPNQRIFPDVKANSFHTVAFLMKPDYKPGDDLQPHPQSFQSKWENDFVPLPCARQNTRIFKIRLQPESDNPEERVRYREERMWMWSRIEAALSLPIMCCADLVSALKHYINIRAELKALNYAIETVMSKAERINFFDKVLPCMQTLCLDTERMVTCPLPLLKKFKNQSVSLSQKQIACLLSNAFFSTLPKRFGDELQFPSINFLELFQSQEDDNENSRLITKAHKIRCILNYFARIADDMPKGVVTYTRKSIRNSTAPNWESSSKTLTKIIPLLAGTIEDDGVGMLQVDFANKMIGGGVLGGGAVQEEILFVIYPELLLARLFAEKLTSCEALIVTGCERFSRYSGYARSFRFDGDFFDTTPLDPKGRRCSQIVGIDALFITRPVTQFHPRFLARELNKAYVGFYSPTTATSIPVATGKWGCGAFNGNPQLKAILQLLAASQVGRDVVFFTFGDSVIQREIDEMYAVIKNNTIEQVWKLLTHYYTLFCTTVNPKYNLHEFFLRYGNSDDLPLAVKESPKPSSSNTIPKFKEVPITSFYAIEPKRSNEKSQQPTSVQVQQPNSSPPTNLLNYYKTEGDSPPRRSSPTVKARRFVPDDGLTDEQIGKLLLHPTGSQNRELCNSSMTANSSVLNNIELIDLELELEPTLLPSVNQTSTVSKDKVDKPPLSLEMTDFYK